MDRGYIFFSQNFKQQPFAHFGYMLMGGWGKLQSYIEDNFRTLTL